MKVQLILASCFAVLLYVTGKPVDKNIYGDCNDKYCPRNNDELVKELHSEESTEDQANGEVIEGDIKLNKLIKDMRQSGSKKDVVIDKKFTWPTNIIPYKLEEGSGDYFKDVVTSALQDFHKFSCVKFIERTTEDDYLFFRYGTGCGSFVGRVGGKQDIDLRDSCLFKGSVIHEIMHALGFFHEVTRLDRDQYIKINFDNVKADRKHDFQKYTKGIADYYSEKYDYLSVMHYGAKAFTNNGKATIEPLDKNIKPDELGQRKGFSKVDLRQLNKAFKCDENSETSVTPKPSVTKTSPTGTAQHKTVDIRFLLEVRTTPVKPFTLYPLSPTQQPQQERKPTGVQCCGIQGFPTWPHSFMWFGQGPAMNAGGPVVCTKICFQMNEDSQMKRCLCHQKAENDPDFEFSDTEQSSGRDCVSVPDTMSAGGKSFLCYSKAAGYRLNWNRINNSTSTCLLMYTQPHNKNSYLCGAEQK